MPLRPGADMPGVFLPGVVHSAGQQTKGTVSDGEWGDNDIDQVAGETHWPGANHHGTGLRHSRAQGAQRRRFGLVETLAYLSIDLVVDVGG
ncbi:hypothetical protein N7462_004763 [Penicillium macrosclerotiorum]|uniref:uncharacterized protein n=1 Tax=Penicillium macrosclerotiorum TaxID=303699 RepID=UPI002546DEB5|nr:uncharacterized protein N7462_004763 [Penicillium macrosclerotiorum]KAJ5690371.1 hypothetical protein N7462_004763 [Penicillium macrosclerotiorum]